MTINNLGCIAPDNKKSIELFLMAQLGFNHGKLAFTINNCFFMYVVPKKAIQYSNWYLWSWWFTHKQGGFFTTKHGGFIFDRWKKKPFIMENQGFKGFTNDILQTPLNGRSTTESSSLNQAWKPKKNNYWGDPTCILRTRIWPKVGGISFLNIS